MNNQLIGLIIFVVAIVLFLGKGCVEKTTSLKECKENVIPERIKLDYYADSNFYQLDRDFKWGEGAKLTNLALPRFYYGNEEGENINFLYSDMFGMEYFRENILSDGTISKDTKFTVYLVIDPNDNTEEGYKIISYECK